MAAEDSNTEESSPRPKPSFWQAFSSPRLLLMVGLGFSSGLPNPLSGSTLTAWMATVGVSLSTIGLFALVQLPYNFKFLWAPLMDRFASSRLGRRRGWMLLTQLCLLVAVGVLGMLDPVSAPFLVAGLAMVLTFFSASQDIAVDAYRTDLLPAHQRASGTAIFVATYRAALIVAGAGALILSDWLPWNVVYLILAALMGVGLLTSYVAPRPDNAPPPPRNLKEAVVEPFKEFIGRRRAWALLALLMFYKVGDAVAGHLLIPFMMETGFSRTEIGALLKGLGLGATIVGALLGGGLCARWGLKRALLVFGVLQAFANISYAVLAYLGQNYAWLTFSIGIDHLLNGMGTAAFVALLMGLCDRRFTATQYALFSSLASVPGRILSGGSGWIAEALNWPAFFLITVVAALPALFILLRLTDAELVAEKDPTEDAEGPHAHA